MSNTRECIHQQASIYKKLSDELLCEEIIESEHRQLMSRKELLAVEIGAKQTDVIALEAQSKKEYNNVRMLRHFSLKSAAATLSGRKKEVAAKEEGKYHLAFENEQRAKRELEAKQSEYAEILKAENTYSSQRAHFHHIRDQLNILLDEVNSQSIHPHCIH
ncbi:hypothetical protein BDB01DRAFT_774274 [Pilobolus umbonatus]|nr:hypothetical protein BDB01DRAFT_774274 [Pilobolus umbonatus]